MITTDNSYFNVPHEFIAYLEPWTENTLPDDDKLKEIQSPGLKLISEVKEMENACLLQLRQLDNEAQAIVDFLKLQSRKVDLVLQYMLEQQSHQGKKVAGINFGGSGFSVNTSQPLTKGHRFKTIIYVADELLSVLCIATVANTVKTESGYSNQLDYSAILDTDVEQLVQASLRVQQKQLKARKQEQQTNNQIITDD